MISKETKEQFTNICKSYGLSIVDNDLCIFGVLNSISICHIVKEDYSYNAEKEGDIFVLKPDFLSIDTTGCLIIYFQHGKCEYAKKVSSIEELRQTIEACLKRYNELKKQYRIDAINEM